MQHVGSHDKVIRKLGNLKERDHLGNLDADGRIILKRTIKNRI